MTVRIVTDSTASIPADLCHQLNITVVPVPIQFGSLTHLDGVDPSAEFYALLKGEVPPSTSTPSPGVFASTYSRLVDEGTEVLSIHVMESGSSLINVARMAAARHPAGQVQVADSGSTSLGMGLMVVAAARAAQAGQSLSQIRALVQRLHSRASLFAAIPDLAQLRRSGRVSLGSALMAGMLSIKPIIYVGQSAIEVVAKVRGWRSTVDRMVALAQSRAQGAVVQLAVVHTNAREEAERLMGAIRNRFECTEAFVAEAGPALAAHAGAGALGIAMLAEEGQARG